jgi:uncharacterized protein (TIGR02118 family)
MYKLIALYPPPADPAHFRRYYEERHLPIARTMPGLVASRHSLAVEGVGAPSPYFCAWEGEFADRAAFEACLASPEGQATAGDIPNYATGGVVLIHYEVREAP